MSKNSDRQAIFNKFAGKCAYCGCDLTKSFHVDHLEPVNRGLQYCTDENGKRLWNSKKMEYKTKSVMYSPHNDHIDNYMPSCASCNNYKHANTLEGFRKAISEQPRKLRAASPMLRLSERYGIVTIVEKPIIFYFETFENK